MPTVANYDPPFLGVDKANKGDDRARGATIRSPLFGELYTRSNSSFLGVYLTHTPIVRRRGQKLYPNTAGHFSSHWTDSWETLRRQGWGAFFIFAGYTTDEGRDNKRPRGFATSPAMQREHGQLHAQQIKVTIHEFLTLYGTDNAGATVFIDCEGGRLTDDLILYYQSLFDELRVPGPGHSQPARPGFYSRDQELHGALNASEMLDRNPDLFVWQIQHHHDAVRRDGNGRILPIPREVKGHIHLDPAQFDISSASTTNIRSNHLIVNIPLGIQGFINYEHAHGFPRMPTRALTNTLIPSSPWDFNMSFVRDPRYPHASPRVGRLGNTMVRGHNVRTELRMAMYLGPGAQAPILSGDAVEPEGPLVLADPGSIVTVSTAGELLISNHDPVSGVWSPLAPVVPTALNPPLRRARGVTAMARGRLWPTSWYRICYIARDLSVRLLYRTGTSSAWVGPARLGARANPPLTVHAFSNIANSQRDPTNSSMCIFTLAASGHLQATTFTPPSDPSTPLAEATRLLETVTGNVPPALLQGTALLALQPYKGVNLVFGVSRTLSLVFWSSVIPKRPVWPTATTPREPPWTGPHRLLEDPAYKLFAHTRLAAHVVSPTVIAVAALSYTGDPALFRFVYNQKTRQWAIPANALTEAFPRIRRMPPDLGRAMPLRQGEGDARRWSVNPYGDINFGVDPSGTGESVLMAAGCGPAESVEVLYRRFGRANEDWYLFS